MPDLWKMRENERRHGKLVWGLVLEGEGPRDVGNIGEGRRDPKRWERGTLRELTREIDTGGLDFIGFSTRALAEEPKHTRGIFAVPEVRAAADAQRLSQARFAAMRDGVAPAPPIAATFFPRTGERARHIVAPKGFPTR